MIGWISSWAQGIVVAVIIATILEMLLPEGKNKKYVKAVIGVYILFTILSPIIEKFTNKNIAIDWEYEKYFENTSAGASFSNNLSTVNNNNIEDIYITKLKADIKTRLSEKGYQTNKIDITINVQDNETYGTIDKVKLQLGKKEQTEEVEQHSTQNEIGAIEPIQKVQIGNTNTSNEISADRRNSSSKQNGNKRSKRIFK